MMKILSPISTSFGDVVCYNTIFRLRNIIIICLNNWHRRRWNRVAALKYGLRTFFFFLKFDWSGLLTFYSLFELLFICFRSPRKRELLFSREPKLTPTNTLLQKELSLMPRELPRLKVHTSSRMNKRSSLLSELRVLWRSHQSPERFSNCWD